MDVKSARQHSECEYLATDAGSFTSAVVSATRRLGSARLWWRGHRVAAWHLRPSLRRNGFDSRERNLNAIFRLKAKARTTNCPRESDALGWLFLMQHYGLPTRLLDWSQSPLVALYFASEEPDDTDAMVWGLAPTTLNVAEAGLTSICTPGSRDISRLGMQAFRSHREPSDERIMAVLADEADLRHMVQQAAFTIHGRSSALDELADNSRFLSRIRIPAAAKKGFRQVLALYGITRAGLFPDLENLARDLKELEFGQFDPEPPTGTS